ncbi:hypothetical protein GCM10027174_34300 [Salinifilum aidingensis]
MSAREFQAVHCIETPVWDENRGGLLFHATSPNTDPHTRTLVERCVAAEPDPDGPARQQPSLLHACDTAYVTARCVSRDGDGEEPGRFTHALVADDPATYGTARPAQLWDAGCWADTPADGGECPAVGAAEAGPLDAQTVRDWVLAQPEGESWLLALLSALEELDGASPARVVFVASDTAAVVRWLAAATLLLPRERALRVGFRVFGPDPRDRRYPVVAVTPDNAGEFADPSGVSEAVVFNAAEGTRSRVTPTSAAAFWVRRFLGGDPFGVVDAVERAHDFGRQRRQRHPEAADRYAAAVLTFDEPVTADETEALADWLRTAAYVLDAETWTPVLDALLAADPDRGVLHRLADVDLGARTGRLWLAVLRAELTAARDSAEGVGDAVPLPAELGWSERDAEQATELVERIVNSTSPERVDAVLRTATRFGLTPRLERTGQAMEQFARWWAERPRLGFDAQRWSCGEQLVELLRQELARRVGRDSAEPAGAAERDGAVEAVRNHWWPLLLPLVRDPASELDALVLRTAVARGEESRREAIDRCRDLLAKSEADVDAEAAWRALFDEVRPSVEEAAGLLAVVPSSAVEESLAQRVFGVLDGATMSPGLLDVLRLVVHHAGPDHEQLRQLWEEDGRLRHWLGALQRTGELPASGADAPQSVSEAVLTARADELASSVLDVSLRVALQIAVGSGETFAQLLAERLPGVWQDRGVPEQRRDRAIALAFAMAWSDSAPDGVRRAVDARLEQWASEHRQGDYIRIHRLLRGVDSDAAGAWQDWLRELSRRPRSQRAPRPREWFRRFLSRR